MARGFALLLPEFADEQQGRRWSERYVSGGCCCWGDDRDNKWACVECGHRWGRP